MTSRRVHLLLVRGVLSLTWCFDTLPVSFRLQSWCPRDGSDRSTGGTVSSLPDTTLCLDDSPADAVLNESDSGQKIHCERCCRLQRHQQGGQSHREFELSFGNPPDHSTINPHLSPQGRLTPTLTLSPQWEAYTENTARVRCALPSQ